MRIILKRGKFEPARWMDGTPVPGVYRNRVTFELFGDEHESAGDIELEVGADEKRKIPKYVRVAYASEADGRIVDCTRAPPDWTRHDDVDPVFVTTACAAVMKDWSAFPVLGTDGKPTRSVQVATVLFTKKKP